MILTEAQTWTALGILGAAFFSMTAVVLRLSGNLLVTQIGRVTDRLDTQIGRVTDRLDTMDARFESIDRRFDRIDTKLARLDDLDRDVQAITKRMFGPEHP
jgi:chaperonin cofactor prefoldin